MFEAIVALSLLFLCTLGYDRFLAQLLGDEEL